MKAILGKKIGMTQVYDEQGVIVPVTVIEAGPCVKSRSAPKKMTAMKPFRSVSERSATS